MFNNFKNISANTGKAWLIYLYHFDYWFCFVRFKWSPHYFRFVSIPDIYLRQIFLSYFNFFVCCLFRFPIDIKKSESISFNSDESFEFIYQNENAYVLESYFSCVNVSLFKYIYIFISKRQAYLQPFLDLEATSTPTPLHLGNVKEYAQSFKWYIRLAKKLFETCKLYYRFRPNMANTISEYFNVDIMHPDFLVCFTATLHLKPKWLFKYHVILWFM